MNCPVCGARLLGNKLCRYCGVTIKQIENSSNLKAKQAFKNKEKEKVCYSTFLPSDVDKQKLLLLTIFVGFFGAGNFYVGKNIKGFFCAISMAIMFVLYFIASNVTGNAGEILFALFEVVCFPCAIVMIMWVTDIMNLIIKKYKVPVVLGDEK